MYIGRVFVMRVYLISEYRDQLLAEDLMYVGSLLGREKS